ncbi:tyrosine-type recombinase/integrase [Streptomyces sp. NPDC086554]|uniref:tyrosine-type recombinase/integrase n=1 Tax=Streptomyces sp. NPDC086554 TaxID=3154864 RepID=UPI00341B1633
MKGSIFKRCGCSVPALDKKTGQPLTDSDGRPKQRQLGRSCPKLRRRNRAWSREHGTWYVLLNLPPIPGAPAQRVRQGGLASHTEAEQLLNDVHHLLALALALALAPKADHPGHARTTIVGLINEALKTRRPLPAYDVLRRKVLFGQPLDEQMTVGEWLAEWLTAKADLRATTRRSNESHLRLYLIPYLGEVQLDRLRVAHVQAMFAVIDDHNDEINENNAARHSLTDTASQAWQAGEWEAARAARKKLAELSPHARPIGAAGKQSVRATLRAALADAQAQQLIQVNIAKLVKLPSAKRPRALVWTPERIRASRETDERPSPVMVWDAAHTTAFLTRARTHTQLRPLFHLIAFTGLRRGEACGLRWADCDLEAAALQIRSQIVQLGWKVETGVPKSDAGERTIALDTATVAVLAAHRRRQMKQRIGKGPKWVNTGLVFTGDDGTPLHPAWVTGQFQQLVREADLPPIRLHDLRHGAATHALSAGVDAKVVQEMLGHSSSTITRDTYTSVVDEVKHHAAGALARIFLAAGLQQSVHPDHAVRPLPTRKP